MKGKESGQRWKVETSGLETTQGGSEGHMASQLSLEYIGRGMEGH